MASVFWDKDRILLVNYLKEGAIITASYYSSLLDKVKKAMHPKG
jgi:Transposase.